MSREEILSILKEIFTDAFDRDNLEISYDTTSSDIDGWDSHMHMNIIEMIEGEFQIQFDMDEIVGMENVGEMIDVIISHV